MKSQILQVNHFIVQQLISENQQHEEELEFLRQQLARQHQQLETEKATDPPNNVRTKDDTHGVRLKGVHSEVADLLRTSHQRSR